MRLWPKKQEDAIPPREKKELANVKRRLDRLEPRVNRLELEVKLYRRDS